MADLPFGCSTCAARWGGQLTCHCTGCHQTFTGLVAFDKHRNKYKCLDPQSVGLVLSNRAYPCWGVAGDKPEFWKEDNHGA